MRKRPFFLALFAALIVLGGLGCIWSRGVVSTDTESGANIFPTPQVSPQTYRNVKYGYSLALYPAGTKWEITDYGEEVKWAGPDNIRLHVLRSEVQDERIAQSRYDRCRDFGGNEPKPGGRPQPEYRTVKGEGWEGTLVLYRNSYRTDLCIRKTPYVLYAFEFYTAGTEQAPTTEEQRKVFVEQIVPSLKFGK